MTAPDRPAADGSDSSVGAAQLPAVPEAADGGLLRVRSSPGRSLMVEVLTCTDVGVVRERNEDRLLVSDLMGRSQLSEGGAGNYDLTVRLPGQEPKAFHGLPCHSGADFRKCGWIGMTGNGTASASFFIDNLNVERMD